MIKKYQWEEEANYLEGLYRQIVAKPIIDGKVTFTEEETASLTPRLAGIVGLMRMQDARDNRDGG